MITLELPYPPSVNHYWRHVGPRVLISRHGREFQEKVRLILAALRLRPLAGPLNVSVNVYPPDHRRRDLDNIQKALFDALQRGGLYEDDSQIVKLVLEKLEPVPNGKTVVSVEERSK